MVSLLVFLVRLPEQGSVVRLFSADPFDPSYVFGKYLEAVDTISHLIWKTRIYFLLKVLETLARTQSDFLSIKTMSNVRERRYYSSY